MALNLTLSPVEAEAVVDGLSSPVYYQVDLPTEEGDLHVWANDELPGEFLVCPSSPTRGNFNVGRHQLVQLLGFYSRCDITCRYYGSGHVPAPLPEAA